MSIRHQTLRGSVVLAVVASLMFLGAPSTQALATPTDVLSAPKADECTGYCVDCLTGPGHAADAAPPGCENCTNKDAAIGGGWHTFCAGWDGCADHECEVTLLSEEAVRIGARQLFVEVTQAVLRNDGKQLVALAEANPQRLHFVASRKAVQITACDGKVIASYQLQPTMLRLLKYSLGQS